MSPTPTLATVTITESAVLTALGNFIVQYITPLVFRSQENRTPMPKGNSVFINATSRKRLNTNIVGYVGAQISGRTEQQNIQYGLQTDFYGTLAGDWAVMFDTLFRSEIASDFFDTPLTGIAPLYTEDAMQVPLVNGEDQYEERWTMTAYLQVNPVVALPQDSFNQVVVGLINVDEKYLTE
jgi:hypothetical protein